MTTISTVQMSHSVEPAASAGIAAVAPTLSTEIITHREGLDALKDEWEALLEDSDQSTFFLRWDWARLWWLSCSPESSRLFLITCRDNFGKLVGLAPFYWRRRTAAFIPGIREILFIGTGTEIKSSEYTDILARRGYERDVARAVARLLADNRDWDRIQLDELPNNSMILPLLAAAAGHRLRMKPSGRTHYVRTDTGIQEFIQNLPRSTRRSLARRTRQLLTRHHCEFVQILTTEALGTALDDLVRLHQARWNSIGQPGSFALPGFDAFLRTAASFCLNKNLLRLWVLKADSRPAAAVLAFCYKGVAHYFQGGFDPSYSKNSIGTVMLGLCIEACIADPQVSEFDFMGGNDPYKDRWTRDCREIYSATWMRHSPRSIAFFFHEGAWHIAKAMMRSALPSPVRASLNRGLSRIRALSSRDRSGTGLNSPARAAGQRSGAGSAGPESAAGAIGRSGEAALLRNSLPEMPAALTQGRSASASQPDPAPGWQSSPSSRRLLTSILEEPGAIDSLQHQWDELLDDSDQGIFFLRWRWTRDWWARYAPPGSKLFLVVCRNAQGTLTGLAPLYCRRLRTLGIPHVRELRFIGTGIHMRSSECLDIIARRGFERDVCTAVIRALRDRADWDRISLAEIAPSSLTARLLAALLGPQARIAVSGCSHYIDTSVGWDDFRSELGKSTRDNVGRYTRRLFTRHECRFARVETDSQLKPVMDALVRLHQARWKERGHSGSFALPHFEEFLRTAVTGGLRDGSLRLWTLEVDSRVAAVLVGFLYKGVMHAFQAGFDPAYSRDSLGTVMLGLCIKASIEEPGIREFDFMGGDDLYKDKWTRKRRDLLSLTFDRPNGRTRALALQERFKKAALISFRAVAPAPLRAAARRRLSPRWEI